MKHRTLSIFLSIFIVNCTSKKDPLIWNNATIDTDISKAPIYSELDKQKELFSAHEKQDSLTKRTSDVEYSRAGGKAFKINNCRAYHKQRSDTLFIKIGIETGLGGDGFIIMYKDKKFYTKPYYYTDLIIPDQPKPAYKIIYQNLTLDKPVYNPEDSLYGFIDFKSIETGENNDTTVHWAKGYFRTKITNR